MSKKSIEVDTKTFFRFWIVIAIILVAAWFLIRAKTGLLLVGLALFLAIAIQPLARKLDNIDKAKERKTLTSILAVAIVVFVVGLVVAVAGPMVVSETGKFLTQAPTTVSRGLDELKGLDNFAAQLGINDFSLQIEGLVKNFSNDILSNLSNVLFSSISTVANILTGTILVVVLTILFLTQGPKILDDFWKTVERNHKESGTVAKRICTKIADVIAKYVTGQIAVGVLDGLVVGIFVFGLSLIFGFSSGLAFPMALISMIFYLVPMFGAFIACALISLLLFFQVPVAGFIFLVFYVVYQQIENNIISPKIQGSSLNLPSLFILISITIGMYMFGLIGAIISIPIAGVIKVLVDEYPNIKKLG